MNRSERIVIGAIFVMIWLLLLPKPRSPCGSPRARSANNLTQIALAFLNQETEKGVLPSMIFAKDGRPLLSWRVAILPYIEEGALHDSFKLDEPWDSPHNLMLLDRMPALFRFPETKEKSLTRYRVFVSDRALPAALRAPFSLTAAPGEEERFRIKAISDGPHRTIAVVEAEEAVPWTKPEGIEFDPAKPLPKRPDLGRGRFLAAFFDGGTRYIPSELNEAELRKWITPRGGEEPGPID